MPLKATMEPTGRFEKFEGVLCRLWKGTTEAGTEIEMYVPCVRAVAGRDQKDLEAALQEVKAERQLTSFDTRLVT